MRSEVRTKEALPGRARGGKKSALGRKITRKKAKKKLQEIKGGEKMRRNAN